MTSRDHNKLSIGQAHAVLAAALLRQLHAVISTGQRWDSAIAAGGRTSQWADHYLVNDRACATAIASSRPQDLEDDLRELLRLRPLIETGMVVPVLEQAAALLADDAALSQTKTDLLRADLTEWVEGQLVMEGPTARECLLFSAVDDDAEAAARQLPGPQALIRADAPQLSAASAAALARVASEDEAVEALREVTREALHAMRTLSPADQREEAAELGRKLQARSRELRRDMDRTRQWKRDIPGAAAPRVPRPSQASR